MLTHRNLVANLAQVDFIDHSAPGDRLVGVLPFFHIYGMVVVLCGVLRKGGCVVTMPHFDLEQYLRFTSEHGVQRAYLVPPIVLALAKHPLVDQFDLSALKYLNSGAAPMARELEESCAARIGCVVRQGYGMTEASPGHALHAGRSAARAPRVVRTARAKHRMPDRGPRDARDVPPASRASC